ncbi:hypothetical protein Ciccas_001584, partial [Cichlidogyrus casuarinus]
MFSRTQTIKEDSAIAVIAQIRASVPTGASYSINLMQVPGNSEMTSWLNSPRPFSTQLDQQSTDTLPILDIISSSNYLYQRVNRYTLRVRAQMNPKDTPTPFPIYTDLVLTFNIEDVNNQIPTFTGSSPLSVRLVETATPNTVVWNIFAFDSDTTPAAFRTVSYALDPSGDAAAFKVQNSQLLTADNQDFTTSKKSLYTVTIRAQDGAPSSFAQRNGLPNVATLTLTVSIIDVNNHPPTFTTNNYAFTISESASIGSTVGKLQATDLDQNTEFLYSLSGSGSQNFIIGPFTGSIQLARHQNALTMPSYSLIATVSDGKFQVSVPVTIAIKKDNIRLPVFNFAANTNSFTYSIQELTTGSLSPSPVAIDSNSPSSLTYSLGGFFAPSFAIDASSAAFTVTKPLVRDLPVAKTIYCLSVLATNSFGTQYATSCVTVDDVNNKPPRWAYPSNVLFLPENFGTAQSFATLNALDADAGANAASSYSLIGTSQQVSVQANGQVFALRNYNYDTLSLAERSFTFNVLATNNQPTFGAAVGAVPMTATGTILVIITDTNNNPPTIVGGNSFQVSMPESTKPETDGYILLASDPDVSDRGQLSCTLTNSNNFFQVAYLPAIEGCAIQLQLVTDALLLKPKVNLNLEAIPAIPPGPQTLNIQVSDSGNRHQVQATVVVRVTAANNHPPIASFTPTQSSTTVLAGSTPPLILTTISYTDPDSTSTRLTPLLSPLSSADGMFQLNLINEKQSQLVLMKFLDREKLISFLGSPTLSPFGNAIQYQSGLVSWPLIVSVSDNENPSLTTTTTFTVNVATPGPTIPTARLSGYTIQDQSPPGTIVLPANIQAVDTDGVVNMDGITYRIVPNTPEANLFQISINQTTKFAALSLKTTISRVTLGRSVIHVPIMASDTLQGQSVARTATSTVSVIITPANGSLAAPVASFSESSVFIPENTNAVRDLAVAVMPSVEAYATDISMRSFAFQQFNDNQLVVRVDNSGLVYARSAAPPSSYSITARISTPSEPALATAASNLNLTLNWMPGSAFNKGLFLRVFNTSLNAIVSRPNTITSQPSPLDRMQNALAQALSVPVSEILIYAVGTNYPNSVDVFLGLHSSPYKDQGLLLSAVRNQMANLNSALSGGASLTADSLIGNCLTEAQSTSSCDGLSGCQNSYMPVTAPPPNPEVTAAVITAESHYGMASAGNSLNQLWTKNGPVITIKDQCTCTGIKSQNQPIHPLL